MTSTGSTLADVKSPLRTYLPLVVGLTCASVGMATIDLDAIDGLGLFSALPSVYFAGLMIVVLGLVQAVVTDRQAGAWCHIVGLAVILHGLPGFVEPHPRFPVAWLHVGFADQIAPQGQLLPLVDARFSWPGFFTTAALLQRIAGTESVLWMIRFTPVAINLIAAVVVSQLALAVGSTRSQSNLAAGLFVAWNWIGQDYFAPQAVGFLMALTLVTVTLRMFPDDPSQAGWRRKLLAAPEVRPIALTDRQGIQLYLAMLTVVAALVITHQLSPAFLGATLVLLALAGRIRVRWFGPIVFLGFLGWLSFGAEAYWLGHLDKLLGSLGDVSGVVGQNVGERASATSDARRLVVRSRLAMSGAIWSVSVVIMLVRRVRRTLDPALLAMFAAPFSALAAQPYGGEVLLRVAFFTLPVCVILIATSVLRPGSSYRSWLAGIGLASSMLVFILARFGNESYERVSTDDLEVTTHLYEVAPDETLVYVLNRQTLVSLDQIAEVRFRSISGNDTVDQVVRDLRWEARSHTVFVLLTGSQELFGREVKGYVATWMTEFERELLRHDAVTVETRRGGSTLLRVEVAES